MLSLLIVKTSDCLGCCFDETFEDFLGVLEDSEDLCCAGILNPKIGVILSGLLWGWEDMEGCGARMGVWGDKLGGWDARLGGWVARLGGWGDRLQDLGVRLRYCDDKLGGGLPSTLFFFLNKKGKKHEIDTKIK